MANLAERQFPAIAPSSGFYPPPSGFYPPPSGFYPSPFGPSTPLWLAVLLSQWPFPDTTTTPKPTTTAPTPIVVLPPPYPYPPLPYPLPPGPSSCNVNCPPVWEPICSTSGSGYMYNFANTCALNAQNCISGTDFRFLYPGICKLK